MRGDFISTGRAHRVCWSAVNAENPRRAIALVGRPNVGKSALFNRLLGRRLAIVHEQWGVTRDRLCGEAEWDGQRFEVIDTGGIGVMDRAAASDEIAEGARRQVDLAIEEAGAVIQVADARAGVHPLDVEVARLLRRSGRSVFVAVNKCDDPSLDDEAAAFAELGFPWFAVSALQRRGLDELIGAAIGVLPSPEPNPTAVHPIRVAVVGRPNAGKSSFINRLLGSDRVIVSEIPGTTRDSVAVPFTIGAGAQARQYVLVDTAGMRPRAKVRDSVEHFSLARVEQAIREADVAVHVLDAAEGPTRQDRHIAGLLRDLAPGAVLLVNKWDLATATTPRAYAEALRRELPFLNYVPIVFASARTGRNVRETIEVIDRVAAQVSAKLSTGLLNRVLHRTVERIQPPAVQGRRLKLYYAAQTGTRPVRIRLFVNDPRVRTPAYEQYLTRELRAAFGLEGAPVRLEFRSSERRTSASARSPAAAGGGARAARKREGRDR